jgi:hypothetical protein
MSTASTAVQLVCPDCRRENEVERIFCHDCGARLDRSAVAKKIPVAESPQQVHKRLETMFSQRRAMFRHSALKVVRLLVAAFVAAALTVMFISPELPPAKDPSVLPAQIGLDLEILTQYRKPPLLRYPENEVNAYLANALKSKRQRLTHSVLEFQRALLGFDEGSCRLTMQRAIFGWPICVTGDFGLTLEGGAVRAVSKGGAIGRLSIHPALMQRATFLFSDFVAAVDREHKLLKRVGSIQLHPHEVVLTAP